jgi:predicted nucleic acid-binding Zn ribbon protein
MKKSYYYECTHCGDILERSQEFASQAFTDLFCYRCGRCRTVRRLICRTTFMLRGKGWAKDSYGLKEATP